MDLVKTSSSQPPRPSEPSKRTERHNKPEARPEAVVAKKAEEQAPPRATTNTRGEKLGQLLNARA